MPGDVLARLSSFLWWTVRPAPAPTVSRFLRSPCCDAPVRQHVEMFTDLLPVSCTRCGAELGAPGREDIDPRDPSPFDQWGCDGQHRGDGTPGCPTTLHHHHDRRCLPPALVQVDEAVGRAYVPPALVGARVEVNGVDLSEYVTSVTLSRIDDEAAGHAG